MKLVLVGLLVLVAFLFLAHVRNHLMRAIVLGLMVPVVVLTTLGRALHHHALPALDRRAREALDHLAYTHPDNDHQVSSGPLWEVVGPVISLVLLAFLVFGDVYLFGLRLAALLQIPSGAVTLRLDWLGAIVWSVMLASLGLALLDLLGATAISRPWHNLRPAWRRFWLYLVFVALALAILAAMLFFLWGQLAIDGHALPLLGWIFITAFGGALQVAILVTGAALLASGLILWFLTVSVLRLSARGVLLLVLMLVWLLDRLAGILVELVDLIAMLGRGLWNWVVSFVGERLHLEKIEWEPRPELGAEIHQPLLPPSIPSSGSDASETVSFSSFD